jgi:hypothetical protein
VPLAAAVTGLRVVAATRGALEQAADCELFLDGPARGGAPAVYTLLPIALNALGGGGAAHVVLELHYPAARTVLADVVLLPATWLARALVARTLTSGALSAFDRIPGALIVAHKTGAGECWAAANIGATPFRLALELSGASLARRDMVATRGAASTADTLRPRAAQLVNALAELPSAAAGWAWASSMHLRAPPDADASVPRAAEGELHAPFSF